MTALQVLQVSRCPVRSPLPFPCVPDRPSKILLVQVGTLFGLHTLFSPSTIYILFAYSFRILVQNRVYILEYGKNTAPNRAYILEYSLYSTR